MKDTKVVKAYCKKTKQYYALEVKKSGTEWKVVNMTFMSKDEAKVVSSEIKQNKFETNKTLLACSACGSRVVGGCSCSKKKHSCFVGMKYNFDCIYCSDFIIDYSMPTSTDVGKRSGETVRLSQGQEVKICFADDKPLNQIYVGVGWDPTNGANNMDVDSTVVVAGQGGYETIYFGNLIHPSGCVIHHGDNLTGETKGQEDDENITVNLNKVPSDRDRIIFILNIYKCRERKQNLGSVKNLYIKLYDPDSRKVLIEYRVMDNLHRDTGMIIGMAYRKNGGWNFRAIGKGSEAEDVRSLAAESIMIN